MPATMTHTSNAAVTAAAVTLVVAISMHTTMLVEMRNMRVMTTEAQPVTSAVGTLVAAADTHAAAAGAAAENALLSAANAACTLVSHANAVATAAPAAAELMKAGVSVKLLGSAAVA
eukprot:539-Heterococcus_DN1.PRE.1